MGAKPPSRIFKGATLEQGFGDSVPDKAEFLKAVTLEQEFGDKVPEKNNIWLTATQVYGMIVST